MPGLRFPTRQVLQALTAAREAAEHLARRPTPTLLDPALRAQLRDLGQHLPALWASGRLMPAHQKELLRSLIRRVILARPTPARLEVTILWVSGVWGVFIRSAGKQRIE